MEPRKLKECGFGLINWPKITNNSSSEVHRRHLWEALWHNHIIFVCRIYLIESLMKHTIFFLVQTNYTHLINA